MKEYFELVIDSTTRKDRSTTHANSFTSYLSTPLYAAESISLVSCSIPYINGSNPSVNNDVHAYYIVLDIPNYGIITNDIYTVRNPPGSGDTNLNFSYTGSLIVPQIDGSSPTNYIISGVDQEITLNKKIPVMNSVKISVYYYNSTTESYELYPFDDSAGTVEEFVIKFTVKATKDKREAIKVIPKTKPSSPVPAATLDAKTLEPLFKKYLEPLEKRDVHHGRGRFKWIVLFVFASLFGFYYFNQQQAG